MKNTEWVALCTKTCGPTTSSSTMILNLASKETLDWQDGNQMETKEWKQGYLEHSDYAQSGQISEKTDVYSFGVVLVEFVTGRKAVDLSRPKGQQCLREIPGAQTLILFSSHSIKKSQVQTANPVCGHCHHLPLLDSCKAHTDNLTPEKYAILSMIQEAICLLKAQDLFIKTLSLALQH